MGAYSQHGNAYEAPNGAEMLPVGAASPKAPGFLMSMGGPNAGAEWSFAAGGAVPGYDEGGAVEDSNGAIDTSDGDSAIEGGGGDTNGSPEQDRIAKALQSVGQVLSLNRSMYGLGDQAAAMPTRPGTQSEYPGGGTYGPGGAPPQQQAGMMPTIPGNQSETPGPYVPQPRPQQMAANMPMLPGSQSNSGIPPQQPMPGPLPPTSNPFGKRNAAIDTDQDEEAA
jgi:hypothetical protein